MGKTILFILTIFLTTICSFGQSIEEVIIPNLNDKYCAYIKKLEAGQTDIDYLYFRFSFIDSEQFIIANQKSSELKNLEKKMYMQISKSNYQEIIKITKQMLSIDYTNIIAHKFLCQTYKIIGDTINAAKYKTIQFGLLNSILKNGDGQSCLDAWPVIQVSEENLILQMVGAKLYKQSIDYDEGLCDKMEVEVDGKKKTYYFEIHKIVEGYKKLGIK